VEETTQAPQPKKPATEAQKNKPEGFMTPKYRELQKLRKIKALLTNPTLKSAYKEVFPNSKCQTNYNANFLTGEVFREVKQLMELEISQTVAANKEILERVLFMVISRWMRQEERTGDMIAAVRELTKLVPEFKDKLQVEDITTASEEELDRKLRNFGYDPNRIPAN
jgi:hypothetical protein